MVISERLLGDVPWVVARGERLAVFRELGAHAGHHIRATVDEMPDLDALRRRVTTDVLTPVAVASERDHPRVWAELKALADGAGAPFDDLLLLNLRGDLGPDGTGCTDLAWCTPDRALIAHNEDGSAWQDGRCSLLTLLVDGDPPVTVWWLPGFIPANTFVLTGHGLAWGIDHLTVPRPAAAPGRHFVAREVQRSGSPAAALADLPSAGGFAYTIGRLGHPEVTLVESAAGHFWTARVGGERPFRWHTNHPLHLPDGVGIPNRNSEDRARFLERVTVPRRPGPPWFLGILTGAPLPNGVHRDDGTVTQATFVVDLLEQQVTLVRRGGEPVTVPVADLLDPPD